MVATSGRQLLPGNKWLSPPPMCPMKSNGFADISFWYPNASGCLRSCGNGYLDPNSIHPINPMQVESIWISDDPSPLSGLAMDTFSMGLFRQCPVTHIHGQDSVH